MAGATITTLSSVLKEFYVGPLTETLNNSVLMLQRIKSSDEHIYGKAAYGPVHTFRNTGVGARGELGTLPSAGAQAFDRWTFDLSYLYGSIQVSGPSMIKTSQDAGAFVRALEYEISGVKNDLVKDLARQFYGNGDGIIATIPTGATSATQTLNSDEPLRKAQIFVNMILDIGTAASPTASGSAKVVSSLSIANKTVTFTGSFTTSNSDIVSRTGSNKANGTYEMNGLLNIVPTAANTLGGIDGSANPSYWDVQRNNQNGALTESNMMQLYNLVRIAGGETSALVTSYGVQRAYYNLKVSQQRFMNTQTLTGGFEALTFFDKPLIADLDAPFGKIYYLDEKDLVMFSDMDWNFLDEDGHTLKWVVNQDAWQAVLRRYLQFGARNRVSQGVLYGITDSTGS